MKIILMAVLAGAALIAGCATKPSDFFEARTAPKIIIKDDKKIWDNVTYFGRVPLNLTAKAAQTCATMNTDKDRFVAKGYHSKALNADGTPFPGGGYYCVAE